MASQIKKYQSILIFGPPGSGKGTIGHFLAEVCDQFHLSTGEVFRGLSKDSKGGQLFERYANHGQLLPDDACIEIFKVYLEGLIATNRYFPSRQFILLDGIPRTIEQAKALDQFLQIQQVIVLEAPSEQVLIERLMKRAVIEARIDDQNEEVLNKRFEVYHRQTKEVLEHYPSSILKRFNADQKPFEVLRDILMELADLFASNELSMNS